MNDLVIMHDQQAVTTSLKVAEIFHKDHKNVLRDIKNLIYGGQLNFEHTPKMFIEYHYTNRQNGQNYPMYYMNRDGFTLLAMGFTGNKAMEFKLAYIQAFNDMEQAQPKLPQTPEEMLALTMLVSNRTVKRVTKVEKRMTDLEENQTITPTECAYIKRQTNKAVWSFAKTHGIASKSDRDKHLRSLMYEDIRGGLNLGLGVKMYTHILRKDFDKVDDFIGTWIPSSGVQLQIRNQQTELPVDDVEA